MKLLEWLGFNKRAKGFFEGLSPEQQADALAYDGPENLGDPKLARKRRLVSRESMPVYAPAIRHAAPVEHHHPPASVAEAKQSAEDHERHATLTAAFRGLEDYPERGAKQLFDALHKEYIDSLLSGRLDLWTKTAHSIVDLLASPTVKIHSRTESPSDYLSDRVFEGSRPLSGERVEALKKNYQRSHPHCP